MRRRRVARRCRSSRSRIELETDTPDTKYFMLTASGDVERAREERRRDEQRRAATRQRGESEAGAAKLDFCSSAGTSSTS